MTVAVNPAKVRTIDMKFEIAVIPVSDVARAKEFYANLGWRFDAEFTNGNDFHILQFTPPGSGASVICGVGISAGFHAPKCFSTIALTFSRWMSPTIMIVVYSGR